MRRRVVRLALAGPKPLPMAFPSFPGMLPGPVPGPGSPGVGPVGPSMPAGLFPTNVKWGDVVNVTGPFAGKFQGQVLVRFAGVSAVAPALTGPFGGSVVVPDGAQTGACTIEVDGRTVFGTNCVVSASTGFVERPARAPEHRGFRAWHNVGQGTPLAAERALMGDSSMAYVDDRTQNTRGVGAIAAKDLGRRRGHRILTGAGVMTLVEGRRAMGAMNLDIDQNDHEQGGPEQGPTPLRVFVAPKKSFFRVATKPPTTSTAVFRGTSVMTFRPPPAAPPRRNETVVVVRGGATTTGGGSTGGGTTSGGGSSSGGGTTGAGGGAWYGGGGGGGGGGATSYGGGVLDALPDDVPEPAGPATAPTAPAWSTKKKVAVAAGAAAAIYLLFGRKRR